jgi:membrane fusion protein, copper/silver efflux system
MTAVRMIATVVGAAAFLAAGYWLGTKNGGHAPAASASMPRGAPQKPGDIDPATGRKVLYWHDPMVPGQKFDKPGKSPFMDMQLVPVYEGDGSQGGVSIDPRLQQSLGVRVTEVRKGVLASRLEAVGSVAYNERESAVVQARSNGFVERLHVRATLDPVRRGQALVDLYVPDWVAAQEEYLSVIRMRGTRMQPLVEGARQRMRLAGMSDEQIALVEKTAKVHPRLTLSAPLSGVVAELGAREGMTVMQGAMLFRINSLSTVWVNAEVRESESAQVRPGASVEAHTPAFSGKVFPGKVSAILPEVTPATRTLKARIELANPERELKPGMFVTVSFAPSEKQEVLLVPSEAIIRTGARSVVIAAEDDGKFAPLEVETGIEAGNDTEIRKGLQVGQKVVLSGQFLIDSEASLRSALTRMGTPPSAQSTPGPSSAYRTTGKVEAIDKEEVTLSHEPVPELKWPAMTMAFRTPAGGLPKDLKVGDDVQFEFGQGADGRFEVRSIRRAKR